MPGPQARVGALQRVRPHHQKLHQDLHRRQARVARPVLVIFFLATCNIVIRQFGHILELAAVLKTG